jgi:cyanosortase A-associated protein
MPGKAGIVKFYHQHSTLLRLMVQLIGITLLLLTLVPSRRLAKILLPIMAIALGFGINGLRVSLLAILAAIPDPESLDYWHYGSGSLIFSGLSVLCLGGVYSLLNIQKEPSCLYLNHPDPIQSISTESDLLSQNWSMNRQETKRREKNFQKLLALVFLPVMGCSWIILKPFFSSQTKPHYQFPHAVPLSGWEHYATGSVNTELVRPPAHITGQFLAGKRYVYGQKDLRLDIEMRYLKETDGDLKSFIHSQFQTISSSLRYHPQLGSYVVYHRYDRAFLTACLNSQGGSTVTSDQFRLNRILYDSRPVRILTWLKGTTNLQDRRCLWAHLSIPFSPTRSPKVTYLSLESVWVE